MPATPLTIAISGLSNAGKTTLSQHLSKIFTTTTTTTPAPLLHQDDFFHPESHIPFSDSLPGVRDWDCGAAIDFPSLRAALQSVKSGVVPNVSSFQDKVSVGDGGVSSREVERLREVVAAAGVGGGGGAVAFVDGFLLFTPELEGAFDVGLFLRAPCGVAKRRREERGVYEGVEGFWEDPEGYWDRIVWPRYVEAHGHMFVGGNVEGEVDEKVVEGMSVHVAGVDWEMKEIVPWAVDIVVKELVKRKQE